MSDIQKVRIENKDLSKFEVIFKLTEKALAKKDNLTNKVEYKDILKTYLECASVVNGSQNRPLTSTEINLFLKELGIQ